MSENKAKILLSIYPSAGKNEVVGFAGGVLRVKISAPPIRGKANRELIAFLSQLLNVGKNNINILKGHTSRNKIVAIDDLSQEEVMKRIVITGRSCG
jgi:uncharacterized protein (TIGR00251 family)